MPCDLAVLLDELSPPPNCFCMCVHLEVQIRAHLHGLSKIHLWICLQRIRSCSLRMAGPWSLMQHRSKRDRANVKGQRDSDSTNPPRPGPQALPRHRPTGTSRGVKRAHFSEPSCDVSSVLALHPLRIAQGLAKPVSTVLDIERRY